MDSRRPPTEGHKFSASVNFGAKQKDNLFVFVPGEELHGFVSIQWNAGPVPFKTCHLVMQGHLLVQNAYNAKKPKPDTRMEKDVGRVVYSYNAKQGDDKVRNFTFNFSTKIPNDWAPSFSWSWPGGKADTVTNASLAYEIFLWFEVAGGPSEPPAQPGALRSPSHAIEVIDAEISKAVGGPKVSGASPQQESRVRAGGEKSGVELELDVHEPTIVVPLEPGQSCTLSFYSDVRVTNKRKACDAILYLVDEIVTITIGAAKPCEYKLSVIRDKTTNWFCDALKSNRNKHSLEISRPRGNDTSGSIKHPSIVADGITIRHQISAIPVMKGLKEGEVKAVLPIHVGIAPRPSARLFELTLC